MTGIDPRLLQVAPTQSGWSWQCLTPDCGQASHGLPTPALAWQAATGHACTSPAAAGQTGIDPGVLAAKARAGRADTQTDPAGIDWPPRQAAALLPFTVRSGRPVTIGPRTGIRGRTGLGRWAETPAADAMVTATSRGVRHLLMVARGDGHGWAIPGGGINPDETPLAAAVRELAEETGLHLPAEAPRHAWRAWAPRWVPDPRSTDESWIVTVAHHVDLGDLDALPGVAGGDDATAAAWIPAVDYPGLHAHLTARGGRVFAAHTGLLTELLTGGQTPPPPTPT